MLDDSTLYWLTNSGTSAARLYWENAGRGVTSAAAQKTAIIEKGKPLLTVVERAPSEVPGGDGMSAKPEHAGQTVVVIGGSAGIGPETARVARAEGAAVILAARDPERLRRVGLELRASIAAFDTTDFERLGRFFDELATPIDHVLVTGPGPYYAPLAQFDVEAACRDVDAHLRRREHEKSDI